MSGQPYTYNLRLRLEEFRRDPKDLKRADYSDLCDVLESQIEFMEALLDDAGGYIPLLSGDQIKMQAFMHIDQAALLLVSTIRFICEVDPLVERDEKRQVGIARATQTSRELKSKAQEIAKNIWEGDEKKEIRTSRAADLVNSQLIDFIIEKGLCPQGEVTTFAPDILTIKKWLREVAPDYAKKPGPPRAQ